MPTVYLPTEHSEAELALAGRVAEALECSALYVTWSPRGYEGPDCEAVLVSAPVIAPGAAPAAPPAGERPRGGFFSRVAALVAAVFTPPAHVERERRPEGP